MSSSRRAAARGDSPRGANGPARSVAADRRAPRPAPPRRHHLRQRHRPRPGRVPRAPTSASCWSTGGSRRRRGARSGLPAERARRRSDRAVSRRRRRAPLRHVRARDPAQTGDGIRVECHDTARDTRLVTISAEYAVGCDGDHGLSRHHHPARRRGGVRQAVPLRLAGHPRPRAPVHGPYHLRPPPRRLRRPHAPHQRGLRYYLQIPPDDGLDRWPDARVWAALHRRLAKGGWRLSEGRSSRSGNSRCRAR